MRTRSGRVYGTSTAAPARKRTVRLAISPKPVSINTRVARILSNRLETKRFLGDSFHNIISADQVNLYVNPFAAITQGNAATNRSGDKITIVGLEFYLTYKGEASDAMDQTWEGSLVQARGSGTYTASSIGLYAGASLNYVGFQTNGPVNTEEYKVISQKRLIYKHPTLSATSFIPQIMMQHKIRMNKTIQYVGNTAALNPSDYLYIITNTTGGTSGFTQGTVYLNYIVFYKDA